jgi:hypothetical protein
MFNLGSTERSWWVLWMARAVLGKAHESPSTQISETVECAALRITFGDRIRESGHTA